MLTTISSQHFDNLLRNSGFIDTGIRCKSHLENVKGLNPRYFLRAWNGEEYKIIKLPCNIREVPIFKDHIYQGNDIAKNYLLDNGFYVPGIDINSLRHDYFNFVDENYFKIYNNLNKNEENNAYVNIVKDKNEKEYYISAKRINDFCNEIQKINNLPYSVERSINSLNSSCGYRGLNNFVLLRENVFSEYLSMVNNCGYDDYQDYLTKKANDKLYFKDYEYKIDKVKTAKNFFKIIIWTIFITWFPINFWLYKHGSYDSFRKSVIIAFYIGLGLVVFDFLYIIILNRKLAKKRIAFFQEIDIERKKALLLDKQITNIANSFLGEQARGEEHEAVYHQYMSELAKEKEVHLIIGKNNKFDLGLSDTIFNCLLYFGFPFTFETGETYRPFYPQNQNYFLEKYENNFSMVNNYLRYLNEFVYPIIRINQAELANNDLFALNKYLINDLRIQMRTNQISNSVNSLKNAIYNESQALTRQFTKLNYNIDNLERKTGEIKSNLSYVSEATRKTNSLVEEIELRAYFTNYH